ncbi:MAG: tyrosine-type recombinase/integrase [Planctomycetota bacterium]|jgi:integrase
MARRQRSDSARIFVFNRANIQGRCRAPHGELNRNGNRVRQKVCWDAKQDCFGMVVSRRSKTFIVQKDVAGRSVRVTIGRYPTWTPEQARERARELIVQMDRGINPNQRKRERAARGVTLAEAVEMHLDAMRAKDCTQRSMANLREEVRRYLGPWVRKALAEVSPDDCARRHKALSERRGRYAANRALACFRACYNTARRRHAHLPENPVAAVTFNKVRRRREPIPWRRLPAWREKVDGITNPVRRDLQLFLLLTGLRSTDARTVRWEHADLRGGTVHRPKPKGGEDRAFTVPLSKEVLRTLRRRRKQNVVLFGDDAGWVFPSHDMQGRVTHVREAKEQRYAPRKKGEKRRKVAYLPSPHRLRDTFIAACVESGVGRVEIKALVNHSLPSNPDDVTEGYYRPSIEHLRGCIEKVTAFLAKKMHGRRGRISDLRHRSSAG